MLICACNINAAYFGILFLVRLGLEATHWLALGVAHFLPTAGGLTCLPLSLLLLHCLFVPVGHL